MKNKLITIFIFIIQLSYSQDNYSLIYLDDWNYSANGNNIISKIKNVVNNSKNPILVTSDPKNPTIYYGKNEILDEIKSLVYNDQEYSDCEMGVNRINNLFNEKNYFFRNLLNNNDDILKNELSFYFFMNEDDFIRDNKTQELISKILHINRLLNCNYDKEIKMDLEKKCNVTLYISSRPKNKLGRDDVNEEVVKMELAKNRIEKIYTLKYY